MEERQGDVGQGGAGRGDQVQDAAHRPEARLFFSSRSRHTGFDCGWSSDVCSSDLEVTTEGGLDVVAHRRELEATIKRLHAAGIRVSLFVDPTLEKIDAAGELGVEMVELHTGKLADRKSVV